MNHASNAGFIPARSFVNLHSYWIRGVRMRLNDSRRFVSIAWILIVAMLLHLVLIVILATLSK